MKKAVLFGFLFLFVANMLCFSEVSADVKSQLVGIFTKYTASDVQGRLQYIRDGAAHENILKQYYGNKDIASTKEIRYGNCYEEDGAYVLTYYREVRSVIRGPHDVPFYAYFLKIGNEYKIDWEATECYNKTSWAVFKAKQDGKPVEMRCYARPSSSHNSYSDNYYSFWLSDNLNGQVSAYVPKDTELGERLLDILSRDDILIPLIFELKYDESISKSKYSTLSRKEVLITKLVQQGLVVK